MKTIPFTCLIILSMSGLSQNNNSKIKALNFFASVSQSKIENVNYSNDQYNNIRYPATANIGLSYIKYINDHFGIMGGIEYSLYKNYLLCNEYHKSATTKKDFFDDEYYTITIADYSQNREMHAIEIPLLLHFEESTLGKPRLFGNIGIKLSSAIASKLEENGTITTMGYYQHPQYSNIGLLVSEDYNYGWRTFTKQTSNTYEYKNISLSIFASAGIYIPINERLHYMCSAYYTLGISDINESQKNTSYENFLGEQNDYQPSKVSAIGLRMGINIPM